MTSHDSFPLTELTGVGPKISAQLQEKGISTGLDLLFYLPMRYDDRTRLTRTSDVRHGQRVLLDAQVIRSQVQFGRRRSLLCQVSVEHLSIGLRFYFFSKQQQAALKPGANVRVIGTVYKGASGLEMYHPEYTVFSNEPPALDTQLTPIYSDTLGLSQKKIRSLMQQCFQRTSDDDIPAYLSGFVGQVSLLAQLNLLHFPNAELSLSALEMGEHPAQQYLIQEELAAHYLSRKQSFDDIKRQAAPAAPSNTLQQQFLDGLPFEMTDAQRRVCGEISSDLNQSSPMMRLLQGDVGSGKTVVATMATLQLVGQGYQVALMAPTEILSQQHATTLRAWFAPLNVRVKCLLGKTPAKKKREILADLMSGKIHVLVGTHAVFQEDVAYARLGLVIVDEQHRFGVHQRLALLSKTEQNGWAPHQLIMTATPIPRTLAMGLYAGMNVSVIDELPKGRQAIDTVLMDGNKRDALLERVLSACNEGRQVYWVCTLIEQSDVMDSQAAEEALDMLTERLPSLRIGLLHGRVKQSDKQRIMDQFVNHELDVLVATTVIEVGVDVPNASIIVIENPERLGLAQLHQLRGRVGRGSTKSYCVLLYGQKLSEFSKARLKIIREHQDGFVIAEEDLKLRGAGDLFGVRQSGDLSMRIANLSRDAYLLESVKQVADQLQQDAPERIDGLMQRWLPNSSVYSQV
ncbi:MAG: ATP-dependent DNA helicase RecG [Pseudomonadota bacterium]